MKVLEYFVHEDDPLSYVIRSSVSLSKDTKEKVRFKYKGKEIVVEPVDNYFTVLEKYPELES